MGVSPMRVDYISHMGDDKSVVNAARASFNKQESGPITEKDVSLLNFLARGFTEDAWEGLAKMLQTSTNIPQIKHIMWKLKTQATHFAPFCHPQLSIRVTAPLAVARQLWKSHVGTTGGDAGYPAWSEESRRYLDTPPSFHLPDKLRRRAEQAKQGSGNSCVEAHVKEELASAYLSSTAHYKALLARGVAPEQARFALATGVMVTWTWTGSLMFFARVINLRKDLHVQQETRDVAEYIEGIVEECFPVSLQALLTGEARLPKSRSWLDRLRNRY